MAGVALRACVTDYGLQMRESPLASPFGPPEHKSYEWFGRSDGLRYS